MAERKVFRKKELWLLAPLLLAAMAAALFFALAPKGQEAVIEVNGAVYREVNLASLTEPEILEVPGELTVTVVLDRDSAQITQSACPDRLCVRQGKITQAGQSVICLPARVAVRLKGGEADGVTY